MAASLSAEVVLRVVLRTAARAHTQQQETRSALRTGTFEPPFPAGLPPYLLLKMVTFSWLLEGVNFNRAGEGTCPGETTSGVVLGATFQGKARC